MKQLLAVVFITLLALGTGCAWISPASETASDGIQVHGHWTVTVSNPDGSVDAVHEFDNALTYAGKHMLPALLLGELSITNYSIVIGQQSNPNDWSCLEESTDQDQIQPTIPYQFSLIPATADRPLLPPDSGTSLVITSICTVKTPTGGNTAVDVVMALIGASNQFDIVQAASKLVSYTASDGSIKQRPELYWIVANSYPSSSNAGDGGIHFTSHSMDEPIPITHGQKIGITVKISFN